MSSAIRDENSFSLGMPTYDLDIIIPVYKVEKYLRQCLDSILSQKTKYKIRALCIDDGSPDNCCRILDEYSSKDERVCVIHQENKGFSGARNSGLALLDSKYLMFIDSDDFLPSDDVVELLVSKAIDSDCDIVGGGYNVVREDGGFQKYVQHREGFSTKSEHFGFPWGKVIKSQLFCNVVFPEGYWFEDSIMRQVVFELATTTWYYDLPVYSYRSREGQITKMARGNVKSIDSLYITLQLFQDRMKLGIPVDDEYVDYLVRLARLINKRTLKLKEDIRKDVFIVYSNWFRNNFASSFSRTDRLYNALIDGDYKKYSLL